MRFFKLISTCTVLVLLLAAPSGAAPDPKPSPMPGQEANLDGIPLRGTVAETMNSSGYTYLLLNADQGRIWVAIPEAKVSPGQEVVCAPGMTMHNFNSKTLDRTFETIVFSPGINQGATPADAPAKAAPGREQSAGSFASALEAEAEGKNGAAKPGMEVMGQSTGSAGAVVPSADVNVNKAAGPNAYSVGECFEQARELNGKTVRVRGKVMKVSQMIMGKNWVHIQDGTGNPLHNQHDLVVTTTDAPEEGGVVTVEGILAANRDFGAGYSYEVLIENARVER